MLLGLVDGDHLPSSLPIENPVDDPSADEFTDNAEYALEVTIPGTGLLVWEVTGYLTAYGWDANTSNIKTYAYLAPTTGVHSTQLWGMAGNRATAACRGNCSTQQSFTLRSVARISQGNVPQGTHCVDFPCAKSWDVRSSGYGWDGGGRLYMNLLTATFYPDCHYPDMVTDTNY